MPASDPRDAKIAELTELLRAALSRIDALEAEVARLRQNSSNSSRPPSADFPVAPKRPTEPTGRPRGGQPGHKHHKRDLLPTAQVSRVVELLPRRCRRCHERLAGSDPQPLRSQTVDVPRIEPHVVEYRQHRLCCAACGEYTRASLPPQAVSSFGPRLRAMVAACTGKYRLAKRATRELLSDFLGVDLALGSICNIEQAMSEAIAQPVERARDYVRQQAAVQLDETGWREEKGRAWLWTGSTPLVTVFTVARSRGAKVAKQILGEDFAGVLISDRWPGYDWAQRRQLCWAHLRRDFQGFVDRGRGGTLCGRELLDLSGLMFRWWHRVRDGTLQRLTFQRRMRKMARRVERLLRSALRCPENTTAAKASEIYKLRRFLWTFVQHEHVPPTNNAAERAIRPAVLWRKGSFGTDSPAGSRFVERILTVAATLRQQARHVLDYLTRAAANYLNGRRVRSLLPADR
ncbi:MAG TPA: IS66 family transposase [Myxococcales bacterium]